MSVGFSSEVGYEVRDEVAVVTMNRPRSLNALNPSLIHALRASVARAQDEDAGALVLRGAGRSFCAGHDLKAAEPSSEQELLENIEALQDVARLLRSGRLPAVAAVHGHAVGAGCELAFSCDLVIAAEDATFALPEVGVGLSVGVGSASPCSWRWVRRELTS